MKELNKELQLTLICTMALVSLWLAAELTIALAL